MDDDIIVYGKSIYMDNIDFRVISKRAKAPVFIYVTAYGMPNTGVDILEELRKDDIEISLIEILVNDWNAQLSPWKAEGIRPEAAAFLGDGKSTLCYITNTVLPRIKEEMPDSIGIYLAGYSLAGLFSLWSIFESNQFDGGVCCSSSLWYPGWKEYVSTRQLVYPKRMYLSLGKKESKTSNQLMASVEDITNITYQKLLVDNNCIDTILVMNPGGHFSNPTKRIADGIKWMVNEIMK